MAATHDSSNVSLEHTAKKMVKTTWPYRPVLERALKHALAHFENLEYTPVSATATLAELRNRLARPLSNTGYPFVKAFTILHLHQITIGAQESPSA